MDAKANPFLRMESIFMENNRPVLVLDEEGRLYYANEALAKLAGLEGDIGMWTGSPTNPFDFLELFDEHGNILTPENWLMGLKPESPAGRLMRRKDGKSGWIRFHTFPISEESRKSRLIVAVGLDTVPLNLKRKAEAGIILEGAGDR